MTPLVSGIHVLGGSKLWSSSSMGDITHLPRVSLEHFHKKIIWRSYKKHPNLGVPSINPWAFTGNQNSFLARWWQMMRTWEHEKWLLFTFAMTYLVTYLLRSTSFLAMKPAELCPFNWSPLLSSTNLLLRISTAASVLLCLGFAQRPGGSFRCARIEPAGGSLPSFLFGFSHLGVSWKP